MSEQENNLIDNNEVVDETPQIEPPIKTKKPVTQEKLEQLKHVTHSIKNASDAPISLARFLCTSVARGIRHHTIQDWRQRPIEVRIHWEL